MERLDDGTVLYGTVRVGEVVVVVVVVMVG